MRPNIILIHSDQHRFDCVGANGHPFLKTPNLDRLAREGVNFTQAYTPSPICSPERASILCGAWTTQHGCLSIPNTETYAPADTKFTTFSHLLNTNGYDLGYVGKYHQEFPGTPLDYGFCDYIPEHAYGAWRKAQGLPDKPRANRWFGETDAAIKPEQSRIAWGASASIDLIKKYNAEKKPFLVRWDPSEPHLPNVVPEPFASMYPPKSIPPWPSFGDALAGKPYIQAQQRRTWKVDDWKWEQWAPIVGRYLGEITLLDHEIGRILALLDELKLADNTLVIYSTDHGDMCGAHGMIDKHFIMYDDVTRVPMMMRYPGELPAGKTCDAFVSHAIDIASTICSAAGITPPSTFAGKNLFDIVNGADAKPREDIFSAWHGGQFSSFTQRMVRNREWKYVWNASAEDELYHMTDDPAELTNRATDTACKAVLSRMRKRLVAWMLETNDVVLNEWTRSSLEDNTKI